jgi:hypothetical protein
VRTARTPVIEAAQCSGTGPFECMVFGQAWQFFEDGLIAVLWLSQDMQSPCQRGELNKGSATSDAHAIFRPAICRAISNRSIVCMGRQTL